VISPVDGVVVVDRPTLPPGRCVASLSDTDPNGFIDTLMTATMLEERVYVSVSWILEMGRKFGLIDPEGETDVDQLHRRVADLEAENALLNRQFDAIDVLESTGYRARKTRARTTPKKAQEK